jgi:hypothetical protein
MVFGGAEALDVSGDGGRWVEHGVLAQGRFFGGDPRRVAAAEVRLRSSAASTLSAVRCGCGGRA